MASLKNVHPCTFLGCKFAGKLVAARNHGHPCQYSDVTVICNVPVANYLASFTKIKFLWNVVSDRSARRPWPYWAKTRLQCAQGWAWNRSATSFGTKLILNRCTWTYIGWEVLRMYNSWRWFKWSHSLNFFAVFIYSTWCVYPFTGKICEILFP